MRLPHLPALLLLALLPLSAVPAADFDHSHSRLDKLLHQYVKNGLVNYAGLKAHRTGLDIYLNQSAAVPRSQFKRWTKDQQIAFLANLYNATTLKLILDHYPVKSIKDIGGWFSTPWKLEVVRLFGEKTTLDNLEHGIIRKDYSEPRLHFALVCAAIGCPPLREEAYVADRLDQQLDDQGKRFLGTATKNRVDAGNRTVYLSPIFKWYGGDFIKAKGSVLAYVKGFFPKGSGDAVNSQFSIAYTDYDWSLNESGAR